MEPRQIATTVSGVACTAGTASIIASLNPSLAPYHSPLLFVGSAALLLGFVGFTRLFLTPPSKIGGELTPKKEFLDPEITPDVLRAKVAGRTSVQIDAITKTYIGKWMLSEGVVSDVSETTADRWLLFVDSKTGSFTVAFAKKWFDQLRALNKGDTVTVSGSILRLHSGPFLDHGEITHIGGPISASELAQPIQETIAAEKAEERVFLPDSVTPLTFKNLAKGQTTIQEQRLMQPYVGKWMYGSGHVRDVSRIGILKPIYQVSIIDSDGHDERLDYPLFFNESMLPNIETLQSGDEVSFFGRIETYSGGGWGLSDCELTGKHPARRTAKAATKRRIQKSST